MSFKKIIFAALFLLLAVSIFAQRLTTQPHFSSVTDLSYKSGTNSVFSCGEDGMVICWNEDEEGDHFQCSDKAIRMIAVHPFENEIAIYETDDMSYHAVSVWDWTYKNKKYTKTYNETVSCLSYSAKGTYLMVGTASYKGLNFYFADNGFQKSVLSSSTGAVTMAQTSGTESSLVVYSPTGMLIYYDLKNGKEKARFSTVADLENPTLYNNNILFAGKTEDTIYSISATTGETVKSIRNPKAFICSVPSDSELLYVTYGDGAYKINSFDGENEKVLQGMYTDSTPTSVVKTSNGYFFGTTEGDIYSLEKQNEYSIVTKDPITKITYTMIKDMCTNPSGYGFFLTENSIFMAEDDSGQLIYLAENPGYTNIIATDSDLYLWSQRTKDSIQSINLLSDDTTPQYVYVPNFSLEEFKVCDDTLVLVEGNSTVTLINRDTNIVEKRYSGTGYLDAILLNNGKELYIGKTAATAPKVPLLMVDTETGETITLNIKATTAFNFETDGNVLYGQMISDSSNKKTAIFEYRPTSRDYKNVISVNGENSLSFLNYSDNCLFTNITDNQVTAIGLRYSKKSKLASSQNIIKTIVVDDTIFGLSSKGVITAYNKKNNSVIGSYILGLDNNLSPIAGN